MRINLNINLEAEDVVLQYIKIVEKGVVVENVWKPFRNFLDNTSSNEENLEFIEDGKNHKLLQNQEKIFSKKVVDREKTQSEKLIGNCLQTIFRVGNQTENFNYTDFVHKTFTEKNFNADIQNKINNENISSQHIEIFKKKFFENNSQRLKETEIFNGDKIFKHINSSSSQNFLSDIFINNRKSEYEILNKSVIEQKRKDNSLKDYLSDSQILMSRCNRENVFEKTSKITSNFEMQNLKNIYRETIKGDGSVVNFNQNIVINCSVEEVQKGELLETLNQHSKDVVSLIKTQNMKGGLIYG